MNCQLQIYQIHKIQYRFGVSTLPDFSFYRIQYPGLAHLFVQFKFEEFQSANQRYILNKLQIRLFQLLMCKSFLQKD